METPKRAQWLKAPATLPHKMALILGLTWWKERTNSCPLICVYNVADTYTHPH